MLYEYFIHVLIESVLLQNVSINYIHGSLFKCSNGT